MIIIIIFFFLISCNTSSELINDTETTNNNEIINAEVGEYDRNNWQHWIDEDNDCQNLRHEILIQQSQEPVIFKTTQECLVISGKWADPYSKEYFTLAEDLDIDHVVPLKEAWLSGGKYWTKDKKKDFANDVDNLLIVDKRINRSKGSKDIANWLPANDDFLCNYVEIWELVKSRYNLSYDDEELLKFNELKRGCP